MSAIPLFLKDCDPTMLRALADADSQNHGTVREVEAVDSEGEKVTFGFSQRRFDAITRMARRVVTDYDTANDPSQFGRRVALHDDGAGMNYLISQLAYVEATMVEKLYKPLQFRDLLPIRTEAALWAESIRYQLIDYVGQAKLINPRSTGDIPRADVATGFVEQNILTPAIGYSYTVLALAQSGYLRQPLDVSRAKAARNGCERTFNNIALFGREHGSYVANGVSHAAAPVLFPGLLNFSTTKLNADGTTSAYTMPSMTIINGLWNKNPTTSAAGTATAQGIIQDINAALRQAWVNSGNNIWPDTILLPPSVAEVMQQPASAYNTDRSILSYIKEFNPMTDATQRPLKIVFTIGLDDTSEFVAGDTSGNRSMILYNSDPEYIGFWIPQSLLFLPPQYERLSISVDGYARCGAGIQVKQPLTTLVVKGL